MATNAQREPGLASSPTMAASDALASAWLATWKSLGGFLAVDAQGTKRVWWPIRRPDDAHAARTALLAMLDAAGPAARDAVFAAAGVRA